MVRARLRRLHSWFRRDRTTFRIDMRPPISWSQLTSASVGLWGIGVEGTASLHRLRAMGVVPLLVDDAPGGAGAAGAEGGEGLEILATTQGGLDALLRCDVVIKS